MPRGPIEGSTIAYRVTVRAMMVFFSNGLGCAGSILVSVVGTLLLLVLVGLINL